MKNNENPNILYLGYSGFPYGLAEMQKILLISKALTQKGASVTILGRRGLHNAERHPDIKRVGHMQGIRYVYSCQSPFRTPRFIKRNIQKPFEGIRELLVVRKINKKQKIDAAVLSTMNFGHVAFYKMLSVIFGFKIILNFVEYNSSITSREGIGNKVNDYFFDRFAVKLSDAVFVISEFLIKILKTLAPDKPYFKIPMMVSVERYDGITKSGAEKYFLFCGAASYKEIIFFNINSFELIKDNDVFLYLVVGGSAGQLDEIKQYISKSAKSNLIKLVSNLTDRELSEFYMNALGLLIPLRDTIQDEARFPHKFGEYLATGNPVVTTNYGEVKYYFREGENALVATSYDEKEFSEKMSFIISHPDQARIIGDNGKKTALEFADYKTYGEKMIRFINEI